MKTLKTEENTDIGKVQGHISLEAEFYLTWVANGCSNHLVTTQNSNYIFSLTFS